MLSKYTGSVYNENFNSQKNLYVVIGSRYNRTFLTLISILSSLYWEKNLVRSRVHVATELVVSGTQ